MHIRDSVRWNARHLLMRVPVIRQREVPRCMELTNSVGERVKRICMRPLVRRELILLMCICLGLTQAFAQNSLPAPEIASPKGAAERFPLYSWSAVTGATQYLVIIDSEPEIACDDVHTSLRSVAAVALIDPAKLCTGGKCGFQFKEGIGWPPGITIIGSRNIGYIHRRTNCKGALHTWVFSVLALQGAAWGKMAGSSFWLNQ